MFFRFYKLFTSLLFIGFFIFPCIVDAKPEINSIAGDIKDNTKLIINGSGFTAKSNPKPLFWWKADFGETPSNLGRKKSWDASKLTGNFSTAVVAPGSNHSVGKDHSTGGAALAGINFDSDRIYFHRKTYEDFDVTENWVYKTGTTHKTFNFKTLRFWYNAGITNNLHINVQGANSNLYKIQPEGTDATIWNNDFTHNHLKQLPKVWKTEEVEYNTSSIGIADGTFHYYQNGSLATNHKVRTRTSKFPNRYNRLFQSQVSNGAKAGSVMYYDSLYIDDTWHRVIVCRSQTWDECEMSEVQIPVNWNNNQIEVILNMGGLSPQSSLFIYVVDKNGVANDNGFPLCLKCPLPPTEKK